MTSNGEEQKQNNGDQFDRVPTTEAERVVSGRPTRNAIRTYFYDRYGIAPEIFEEYTFWERGDGKIWAFHGSLRTPVRIEALVMFVLRTRQEHWKPTLEAAQRFGHHASSCVVHLSRDEAQSFLAGEDQPLSWDGDWGYLIVTHDLAGASEPLGVGLYLHGELRSQVPKGRQRTF